MKDVCEKPEKNSIWKYLRYFIPTALGLKFSIKDVW